MDNKTRSIDNNVAGQVQGLPMAGYTAQRPVSRRGTSLMFWLATSLVVLVVVVAIVGLVGLGRIFDRLSSVSVGELRTESQSVPVGSAGSVAVSVDMGQGTLTLSGGATDLLDADFSYNVAEWKPQVSYSETGSQGTLSVRQQHDVGFVRTPDSVRNDWNLHLKNGVPITLVSNLGAGKATIKLDGLSVSKFDMSSGAAETTLDLTGDWKQNLNAHLKIGVGDTTIRLPKDVGVRLTVDGGVSGVSAGGLSHNGKYYTNDVYGKTAVSLEISVDTGVGNVKIETER
jgi:hypothetical protein